MIVVVEVRGSWGFNVCAAFYVGMEMESGTVWYGVEILEVLVWGITDLGRLNDCMNMENEYFTMITLKSWLARNIECLNVMPKIQKVTNQS